jgi:hypothetical protein
MEPEAPLERGPDPLRMYLVARRGALTDLGRAGELAGAAAVACVRSFEQEPAYAEAFALWRPRPGKVVLRARAGQWPRVLEEPHAAAGDPAGEAVVALPPRRRSRRGLLLEQLQAMTSRLAAPGAEPGAAAAEHTVSYVLNPTLAMSSGKTLAQIAHAAVMACDTGRVEDWVAAGCPARLLMPSPPAFRALARSDDLLARVVDAGLTEVPPGTVTVLALAP